MGGGIGGLMAGGMSDLGGMGGLGGDSRGGGFMRVGWPANMRDRELGVMGGRNGGTGRGGSGGGSDMADYGGGMRMGDPGGRMGPHSAPDEPMGGRRRGAGPMDDEPMGAGPMLGGSIGGRSMGFGPMGGGPMGGGPAGPDVAALAQQAFMRGRAAALRDQLSASPFGMGGFGDMGGMSDGGAPQRRRRQPPRRGMFG